MSNTRQLLMAAAIATAPLYGVTCADPLGPVSALVVVSGDLQATLPGGQVPRPLVVRAFGANGAPLADVLVHWSGSTGSRFASDTSRTDAAGLARGVWLLGAAGAYSATVESEDLAVANFTAHASNDAVVLAAVPSTLTFGALDDTATVRIRVRDVNGQLDTLIDPRGWSSGPNPVAMPAYTGTGRMVLKSIRNGVSQQSVNFGTVPAPLTVIVQQVPADIRIVRLGTDLLTPDTIVLGPDTSLSVGVVSVDSRGQPVRDSSARTGVTWSASNPAVATIENGIVNGTAIVRGIMDGDARITAQAGVRALEAAVRVWTLRPVEIGAGGGSTCAVLENAGLACWGFREVGNNSELNVALAPEVRSGVSLTGLSMSDEGACGLTTAGAARCWGSNESGQLGNGITSGYLALPVPVAGNNVYTAISAGPTRSCALATTGKVFCWGNGYEGALGDGTYGATPCGNGFTCTTTPTEVAGGRTYVQVTAGASHACAVTSGGQAYCWGSNRYGQLGSPRVTCAGYVGGNPATSQSWCSTEPVEVAGGRAFKRIDAGDINTCGITTDDALFCWGTNLNGVIGVASLPEGGNTINAEPVAVAPDTKFATLSLTQSHACAIDTNGGAWCWGMNFIGQLGTGTTPTGQCVNGPCERAPVRVAGGLTFKSVSVGVSHTCGLTTANSLYCWGWGGSGALGTGLKSNQPTPVRVAFQKP